MRFRAKVVFALLGVCVIAAVIYVPPVRGFYDKALTKYLGPSYLADMVQQGRFDKVVRYVKAGRSLERSATEPNGPAADNSSQPLVIACELHDPDCALYLMKSGAKVNVVDWAKKTPLHAAVMRGNLRVVKELLSRGANVNSRDREGKTPLDTVLKSNNVQDNSEVVRLLLKKGGRVTQCPEDYADLTPYPLADRRGTLTILAARALHRMPEALVESCLENGTSLGVIDSIFNSNLLLLAADKCSAETVAKVVDYGYSPNLRGVYGGSECTPLHVAARKGQKDVVELLVARGADVNAKDSDGRTPLDLLEKKRVVR